MTISITGLALLFAVTFAARMPAQADTIIGPKLVTWENVGYTLTYTVFAPPIYTLGGVAQNRGEPLPDWYPCYRRLGDFTQDFNTYRGNGTEEYFQHAAFTEANYNLAKAAQQQDPSKETLLYSIVMKKGARELLFLGHLVDEWSPAIPEDKSKIARSVFRRDNGGDWKAHNPKGEDEKWYRLFPVSDASKISALLGATKFEKGADGELKPAAP